MQATYDRMARIIPAENIFVTTRRRYYNLPLEYEGTKFSITITIGVAENDFRSPTAAILEQADQRLYHGKMNGRDQVVL